VNIRPFEKPLSVCDRETSHADGIMIYRKEYKMNTDTLAPQELVRKAVIEVAQLPEKELLIVIEMVDTLKKQRARPNRELAAQIVARAKARAEEMKNLSHEEVVQRFIDATERIRQTAIAKGTAIEGEWESD
jgi:hypothetical protein